MHVKITRHIDFDTENKPLILPTNTPIDTVMLKTSLPLRGKLSYDSKTKTVTLEVKKVKCEHGNTISEKT